MRTEPMGAGTTESPRIGGLSDFWLVAAMRLANRCYRPRDHPHDYRQLTRGRRATDLGAFQAHDFDPLTGFVADGCFVAYHLSIDGRLADIDVARFAFGCRSLRDCRSNRRKAEAGRCDESDDDCADLGVHVACLLEGLVGL